MRDKHIKIWAEQEAFKTYKRTDARFMELVDRLIKEETEDEITHAEIELNAFVNEGFENRNP